MYEYCKGFFFLSFLCFFDIAGGRSLTSQQAKIAASALEENAADALTATPVVCPALDATIVGLGVLSLGCKIVGVVIAVTFTFATSEDCPPCPDLAERPSHFDVTVHLQSPYRVHPTSYPALPFSTSHHQPQLSWSWRSATLRRGTG